MTEPGTILNGRLRLDQLIGQGGFAQVFLSTDLVLGRQVAVKILRPDQIEDTDTDSFLDRFSAEARLIARLEHPHILGLYDYGQSDGFAYLVMPYIAGGSLHDLRRRVGRFSPAQVVGYLRQIAAALDYAHANSIVHRDIKPQNMLLRAGDGQLLVADFGIAKVLREDSTHSGTAVIGSASYMAPEQFQGRVGRPTDIYALGCVAFELLTGTLPFPGPAERSMFGHIYGDIPRLDVAVPDMPSALQAVIDRALAKLPDDRFPSAGTFADAFALALGTPQGHASASAQEQPTSRLEPLAASQLVRIAAAPTTLLPPAAAAPISVRPGTPSQSRSPRSLVPWRVSGVVAVLVFIGLGLWNIFNRLTPTPIQEASSLPIATAVLVPRAAIPLPGHTKTVERAAWSPNGEFLATASEDATARWWRKDGTLVRELTAHTNAVRGLAWSPDGTRLATGDNDGGVLIWEETADQPIVAYRGNSFGVSALIWSPDGKSLVLANDKIRALQVDNWQEIAIFGDSSVARVFAWSRQGRLAAGGKDGSLRLFGADGALIANLQGHTRDVTSVAWSPAGDHLVSAGGNLLLWDARTGQRLASLMGHADKVNSVAWSPDGENIVSGSDDRTMRLWRTDGSVWKEVSIPDRGVTQVAWLRDGTLVSGDSGGTLRWWSASGTLLDQEKAGGCSVLLLAPAPTHPRIAVTLLCGTAEIWP